MAVAETNTGLQDSISVFIDEIAAADLRGIPIVREPSLFSRGDLLIPAAAMPPQLSKEAGAFLAKAQVALEISADGKPGDCRPISANVRLQGQTEWTTTTQNVGLAACQLLGRYSMFRYALSEDGSAAPVAAKMTVFFRRWGGLPVLPPPPVYWPNTKKTSGHVIDASGRWIGDDWLNSRYTINEPNWATALSNRNKLPKTARVGVLLKLQPKLQFRYIEACKVEISSGDARLDADTCAALTASSYSYPDSYYREPVIDDYPVIVEWHRDRAIIKPLPNVTVPHMPKDVTLRTNDAPAGERPATLSVQMDIRIASDAKIDRCTVVRGSGSDTYDAASCRLARARANFTPALDRFGKPTLGLYQAVADWEKMTIRPLWP